MRLAPRTLFGRLMLVLVSGLVLAQLASVAINLQERDSVLARASGMRPAQRIADLVKLLDSLGPAERARIAAVLDVPPLSISLDRPPPGEAAATNGGAHAAMFTAMLRAAIGDDRPIRVAFSGAPPRPPGPGRADGPAGPGPHRMGPGGRHFGPEGPTIFAQVRLRDGSWAAFHLRAADLHANPPWRLLATLAMLLAVVLLLSWFAVRLVTRPLKVLASAADELGRDLYRPPLPESGPTEVARAARAFNTMQQRLVHTIEERMRLLTAMSHDLKTPITRMRLRTDLLDDEQARGKFEGDLLEMEAMVTQTLEFMRSLGSHEPEEPIDVMALLEQVRSDNAAMGRSVTVSGAAARAFVGAPGLLKRCIANLVDNAILYGKRAQIEVDDAPAALEIRILDHGPGIAERDMERVFEPFFRLEASRNRDTGGTGLGLSIARNIARAHGGEVLLRNAPAGGLEAILRLPRPSHAHDRRE
jgi:signal transduction histidine kinase